MIIQHVFFTLKLQNKQYKRIWGFSLLLLYIYRCRQNALNSVWKLFCSFPMSSLCSALYSSHFLDFLFQLWTFVWTLFLYICVFVFVLCILIFLFLVCPSPQFSYVHVLPFPVLLWPSLPVPPMCHCWSLHSCDRVHLTSCVSPGFSYSVCVRSSLHFGSVQSSSCVSVLSFSSWITWVL